jgi:hypothetical protein
MMWEGRWDYTTVVDIKNKMLSISMLMSNHGMHSLIILGEKLRRIFCNQELSNALANGDHFPQFIYYRYHKNPGKEQIYAKNDVVPPNFCTNNTQILSRHLQPGTWKLFHPDARTPIDCPYGTISCAGSHATSLNYTTSLVHRLVNGTDIGLLTDEAYCNEYFSGALCSQSSSGYYIDWSSRQSLACHVGTSSSLLLSLMLCIPLALLLPIAICWTVGRKYRKSDKKDDDYSIPLLMLPSQIRWLKSYEAENNLSNTSQLLDNVDLFGT